MSNQRGDDLDDDFVIDELVALSGDEDDQDDAQAEATDDVRGLLSEDEEGPSAAEQLIKDQASVDKKRKRREKEKERKAKVRDNFYVLRACQLQFYCVFRR